MIYRLIYSSIAVAPLSGEVLEALMQKSRRYNEAWAITGLLLHITTEDPETASFVQLLEGEEGEVKRLFAAIQQDELHHDLEILLDGPMPQRTFADWKMRLEVMSMHKIREAFADDGVDTAPMSLITLIRNPVAMRSLVSLCAR